MRQYKNMSITHLVPNAPVLHVASIGAIAAPVLHAYSEYAAIPGAILGAIYYMILIADRWQRYRNDRADQRQDRADDRSDARYSRHSHDEGDT